MVIFFSKDLIWGPVKKTWWYNFKVQVLTLRAAKDTMFQNTKFLRDGENNYFKTDK